MNKIYSVNRVCICSTPLMWERSSDEGASIAHRRQTATGRHCATKSVVGVARIRATNVSVRAGNDFAEAARSRYAVDHTAARVVLMLAVAIVGRRRRRRLTFRSGVDHPVRAHAIVVFDNRTRDAARFLVEMVDDVTSPDAECPRWTVHAPALTVGVSPAIHEVRIWPNSAKVVARIINTARLWLFGISFNLTEDFIMKFIDKKSAVSIRHQ
jgi:hypothetical protein